ncbi:hypothetical protein [Nocardia neocaledoniensis]|uniref:hypothetical protein n=1 Tax=Nocardia neocaledoniensis TaxID=236511 RepID=UPI00245703F1|nr:hypothetical protein [Nocardia neocaledoniensis]
MNPSPLARRLGTVPSTGGSSGLGAVTMGEGIAGERADLAGAAASAGEVGMTP